MPQKRGEVVEEVRAGQMPPDTYEIWLKKQVKAKSGSLRDLDEEDEEDEEEDEIDRTEDLHEKAHRRKRGKGAPSSS
jgi:hypothetical protein